MLLGPDPPHTPGPGGALSCINHFRANNPQKPSPNLPLAAQEGQAHLQSLALHLMALGWAGINEGQPPKSGLPGVAEIGGRLSQCCMIIQKVLSSSQVLKGRSGCGAAELYP